jgi:hypothetical protein
MKIETYKEFHKNGQLAYSDDRVYFCNIEELTEEQKKAAIVKDDKSGFYRVGITQKIFENGQLAYKIDRDLKTFESYRKDGTPVII